MKELSHVDESGKARMVDVGHKKDQLRIALAQGFIRLNPETLRLIRENQVRKGDVLTVAQVAGIQAGKKTSDLIPLCHPLPISAVTVDLAPNEADTAIDIEATVRTTGRTGVEMEALTAASVAALTVYDMCKAIDRGMRIDGLRVVHKAGGKSGEFTQA